MNIMTNANEIRKSIKTISDSRTKLVDRIQIAALSVIQHAHVHGDITLANALCVAVGDGMKQQALRLYLSEFGPMNPNVDKETNKGAPLTYAKGKRVDAEVLASHMEAAAEVMWYAYKTETDATEFSLARDLNALLGRVKKAVDSGVTFSEDERKVIDALYQAGVVLPAPKRKAVKS